MEKPAGAIGAGLGCTRAQPEPVGRGRGGELPTSGLLEGGDGLLAVGEVVERLSRVA
jgi:hypothetical protein